MKTQKRNNPKKHSEARRKMRRDWQPAQAGTAVVMMIKLPEGMDPNSEEAKKYLRNNPKMYIPRPAPKDRVLTLPPLKQV